MTPDKKSKADYGFIALNVRGDKKYANSLKNRANDANMPLADYLREKLDCAIACDDSFFDQGGKSDNQIGKV